MKTRRAGERTSWYAEAWAWVTERVDGEDCAVLAGVASATFGVGMIYVPAAWIFGGLTLTGLTLWRARP